MSVLRMVQASGCLAAWLLAGSSGSAPSSDSEPFREHRPSLATSATRQLGEDCTLNGYAICLSGLCGHFAVSAGTGYFCTRKCDVTENCPQNWDCNQVHPSAKICVPPSSWNGGAAALRVGGVE